VSARNVITAVALAFIAFLTFLTFYDAIDNGVSFLTIVSLGVLILLGVGIIGALSQGSDE
jgi:hypothetical protein